MAADNTVDIIVNQKASFEVTFTINDGNSALNLSGYTAAAKLKSNYQMPDNQAVSFTTTITSASGGQIKIALTPEQTANLQLQKYVYDLTITDATGFKTRVVEGSVKVSGGVS